ncbi:ribonuclease H-like domain-containing protein [Neobacillus mesonae]|uniref:ribonuclease H-like domain-containing protein n=1 Tax=Neobacillus mesonae TaxID=1193713 RepID=UPI00203C4211|nr:ribonuclease H-like domain-containing protein [Neobacillus mesonae]MCM3566833.1 ribonuclease H-like domain-containing protein [Neobacillus mesonae]
MSLKNKLNRLRPHLSVGNQSDKSIISKESPDIEVPFRERWEEADVFPYFFDHNYCLIREVKYPLSQKHGYYRFQDFLTAVDIWNKQDVSHPLSARGFAPEELFFFDTETTGLGGGVGNTIFLLGYASIMENHLLVRQHILPNPGAEVPLYQSFLENVNYKTLVTYNGKSFDWPQVKTRHTLVRDHVPKLPAFGHFDLLHAAKRLWKHKLERLKLSVVENEVLGVKREDDIPGFLAPMIYFDFIDSKQPDGMIGILKHNEIDILSLVTLYTHLTFQICGIDPGQTRMETYEVGRWFASLGEKEEAEKTLSKLKDNKDAAFFRAALELGFQAKKNHNWEKAKTLFLDAADSMDMLLCLKASVELAKIYEHRLKDLQQAFFFCEKAISLSGAMTDQKLPDELTEERLYKRRLRLEKKMKKPQEIQEISYKNLS